MSTVLQIGKRNTLTVVRDSTVGLYLDAGERGEILMPNKYVPRKFERGDKLEVFVYRDSEDRLVATTEIPRAVVGEVASLKVVGVNRQVGAFLDWGLAKDLLLPFREQIGPVRVGDEVSVRIYLDEKTQRVVASMKLSGAVAAVAKTAHYRAGQAVEFVLSEKVPLGYKTLVDGAQPGMLYKESIVKPVAVGQKLKGFVRGVRPDGKLDLTLEPPGHQRVAPLAERIVQNLERSGGRLSFDDDSSPEAIRLAFGVSKKAFKQAIGALYKSRRIRFSKPGIELLDNTNWSPENRPPAN